jgi:hypothetical protein
MTKGKEVRSFSFHGFNGRSKGISNLHLMPALAGSVKGYSPSAAHSQGGQVCLGAESSEDPHGPTQNPRADRRLTPRRSEPHGQTIPLKKAETLERERGGPSAVRDAGVVEGIWKHDNRSL